MHELHSVPIFLMANSNLRIINLRSCNVSGHKRHDTVVAVVDSHSLIVLLDYLTDVIQVVIEPTRPWVKHATVTCERDLTGDTQRLSPMRRIATIIDASTLLQELSFRRNQEIEKELDDVLDVPTPFGLGSEALHAIFDVRDCIAHVVGPIPNL